MSPYILASSHELSHEFQSMPAFQLWVLSGTKRQHVTSMLHYLHPGNAVCRLDSSSTAWCGPLESPGGGSPILPRVEVIAELPQRLPCALNSPRPLSTAGCLAGFLPSRTELRTITRKYRESSCCVQLNQKIKVQKAKEFLDYLVNSKVCAFGDILILNKCSVFFNISLSFIPLSKQHLYCSDTLLFKKFSCVTGDTGVIKERQLSLLTIIANQARESSIPPLIQIGPLVSVLLITRVIVHQFSGSSFSPILLS